MSGYPWTRRPTVDVGGSSRDAAIEARVHLRDAFGTGGCKQLPAARESPRRLPVIANDQIWGSSSPRTHVRSPMDLSPDGRARCVEPPCGVEICACLPARMTVRLKRFAEVAQTQRADRF